MGTSTFTMEYKTRIISSMLQRIHLSFCVSMISNNFLFFFLLLVSGTAINAEIQKPTQTLQETRVFANKSVDIICGEESNQIKACHVKTPQGEYFMAFDGAYYEERRLKAIFEPFKCGVTVIDIKETDEGIWECVATEQEQGKGPRFLTTGYNITVGSLPLTVFHSNSSALSSKVDTDNVPENSNNLYLYIFIPLGCVIAIFIFVFLLNKKLSNKKAGMEKASKNTECEDLDIESNKEKSSKSNPIISMKSIIDNDELNAE